MKKQHDQNISWEFNCPPPHPWYCKLNSVYCFKHKMSIYSNTGNVDVPRFPVSPVLIKCEILSSQKEMNEWTSCLGWLAGVQRGVHRIRVDLRGVEREGRRRWEEGETGARAGQSVGSQRRGTTSPLVLCLVQRPLKVRVSQATSRLFSHRLAQLFKSTWCVASGCASGSFLLTGRNLSCHLREIRKSSQTILSTEHQIFNHQVNLLTF